jgi:hypothetical protein
MNNKATENNSVRSLSSMLLIGASVLTLSACLPEEEVADNNRDAEFAQAQIALFSQTFQNYSNQSLNAFVNSDVWQMQVANIEGEIDLTNAIYGSLNLGNAEDIIQSAYCEVGADSYHLTWFETADTDGNVFLKGLGKAQSGQTALKIKGLIPEDSFAVMRANQLKKADGTLLSLGGVCSTLDIPEGSAVATIRIDAPINVAEAQEKMITRAQSCANGENGAIQERVNATYLSD